MNFATKRAFLFDLDGTLVDSSPLHDRAFRHALRRRHPELERTFDYEPAKGKTSQQVFRELGLPPDEVAELAAEKQAHYRAAVESGQLGLFPGARPLLEFLVRHGRDLFLVTGASPTSAMAALRATAIHGFFRGMITAHDGTRGKPDPDLYLRCLWLHHIRKPEAVGVEDAENGIRACRSAGIDVALVNNQRFEKWPTRFATIAKFRQAVARQLHRPS